MESPSTHPVNGGTQQADNQKCDQWADPSVLLVVSQLEQLTCRVAERWWFLEQGEPGIYTRNHELGDGLVLIDPRELIDEHVSIIIARIRKFLGV